MPRRYNRDHMQSAQLLAIGTELTLGQGLDTNSPWLAQRLSALGVRTMAHVTVPDELDEIVSALRRAADQADIVLCTGGLGPTDDDLTRAALAQAAGVQLVLHESSLQHLRDFFAQRRRDMPERNRVQACLPAGAESLPNACGTAPGISMRIGAASVFSMPGVPHEMRAMFEQYVAPKLRGGGVLLSRAIRTCGRAEAEVNDLLGDLMLRGRNPEVGTAASLGEIIVRINAEAADEPCANRLLDETERMVRERLTWAVYGRGDETLGSAVGTILGHRRQTVCVAESCTAGLLGAMLTETPGSSAYFLGGVIAYSNRCKQDLLGVAAATIDGFGAVSAEAAEEMARGAQRRFQADHSLAITGIAGPGGGTPEKPVGLVYLGYADRHSAASKELHYGPDQPRQEIRQRAARAALQWLRRRLLASQDSIR